MLLTNSNDNIGNGTHDLPSCSTVFAMVATLIFRIEKQVLCFQCLFFFEIVQEKEFCTSTF